MLGSLLRQGRHSLTPAIIHQVLKEARTIIADRQCRLRGLEPVTADGRECDPCGGEARRFCAVGALIHAAYELTGDRENAQSLGWQVAGMVADAAKLPRLADRGWSLALLSDTQEAAVLRAVDALIGQRRA